MLGLIKKELLMIKGNFKLITIMLVICCFMSLQGTTDLSFFAPILVVVACLSTFSYDQYNKWDAYAITLPNGRKNVVKAKYIATLLLGIITIVLSALLEVIIGNMKNGVDYEVVLTLVVGSIMAISVLISIIYPLVFKFGVEKGRIILFIATFAIIAICGILFKQDITTQMETTQFLDAYGTVILPVIIFLMLGISYKISQRIYSKKDF